MARTKQTARAAIVRAVPKMRAARIKKARAPRGLNRSASPSRSEYQEEPIDVNTQQFSVKFDNQAECQKNSLQYHVIECKNCQAFLNSHSKIQQVINLTQPNNQRSTNQRSQRSLRSNVIDDAKKQQIQSPKYREWICQFCFTTNTIPNDFVQPTIENPCYLLEKGEVSNINSESLNQETTIIYCIDISGSMDTIVERKTRLGAVQEAISDEIKRIKFQKEKVKIGIITFGSYVTLYAQQQSNVPQKLYNDFKQITNHVKKTKDISLSIDKNFNIIRDIINGLTTYGSTALGPGVVAAIQMASKGKKGAKIVLCTDGEANVGLQDTAFYNQAALYAKQKGVMISILTLKGDRCNLKQLGKLSLSTGGYVMKIDPNLLGTQFNKISKEVLLGMESLLTIKVSHLIQIENAVEGQLSANKTTLVKNYGNFIADTELTFSFKMLSKEEARVKGINAELFNQPRAPMQIQLKYLSPNGSKYLQVITDYRELTQNQNDLLKDMNFGLFSATTLQKVSKFIKDEQFQQARDQIKKYKSLVSELFSKTEGKETINKFGKRVQQLQNILTSKQNKKTGKTKRSKTVVQTKQIKSKKITRNRSRSRSRSRDNNKNKRKLISVSSQSGQDQNDNLSLSSDGQQQILMQEMRARSVSVDSN